MHQFKVKVANIGWLFVNLETLPSGCGCDGSLNEWLEADLLERYSFDETIEFECIRKLDRSTKIGTKTLRLVYVGRAYGGPEEGGWYYSVETTERTYEVPAASFQRHRERLERYCIAVNKGIPSWRSDELLRVASGPERQRSRPHYC